MRIVRWGAAAAAAVATCVPAVAEAATPSTQGTMPTPGATAQQTVKSKTATVTPSAPSTPAPAPVSSPANAPAPSTQPTSSSQVKSQDTTVTNPAPPGSAEAYALRVGSVAAISHTKASASGSGTSSTANALELGGNPPASQFGGTQTGFGESKGALIDTGTTPLGRLAVAPWDANNGTNSAEGLADLVLLDLGTQGTQQSASLRVLQSDSKANYTPTSSTGSASSDGAILNLGGPSGLNVDVLHSESSSSGAGSSYLLSVNGNQIGTSQQTNGKCAITIPGLLTVDCLTSTGGTATNGVIPSGGAVGTLDLGNGGLTGALIQSNSASTAAPASVNPPTVSSGSGGAPETGPSSSAPAANAAEAAPSTAASHAASSLPFTGANIGILLGSALGLAGAGFGLVAAARRRRPALAARA